MRVNLAPGIRSFLLDTQSSEEQSIEITLNALAEQLPKRLAQERYADLNDFTETYWSFWSD
ncbi:MAG: hypothetical protein IPJ05_14030 [Nitrosomonas sp.]|nr:hypothetical protein [Nitrosomonas sp.]